MKPGIHIRIEQIMDPLEMELILESWRRLEPRREATALAFYERLFQLDPRIRDLVAATEMDSQAGKF